MSALLLACLAVPRIALPLDGVLGRVLVESLPPDGIVVKIECDICKDSVLLCCGERVGVGLFVCAGCNPEEAVFRVNGIESAVGSFSYP